MKRLAIALSIIVLLIIFSPGFSTLAQPTHTPHENPVTAKSSLDSAALLLSYSNVLDLASVRQYQTAQDILSELGQVNIPGEVRYTTDRYNTLSRQLFNALNNAEFLLNESSTLFSNNQISKAKEKLNDATATIRNAQFLLGDIEGATNTLANNLGVFTASASSQIKQAYDRLEQGLNRLRQLTDELNRLLERLGLNPLMTIEANFYRTTLLEVLAPEIAIPGLPVTISGQVSSTDGNIERTIKILLDNIQLAEETTPGKFSLEITPPPRISTGRHSLTVMATRKGRYSGASKRLSIDISRLPIQTYIQMPPFVITPKSIQISGKVYYNLSPIQDARISLTFKNFSSIVRTDANGSFTTSVDAPLDLSLAGLQPLTITIEPIEPWYDSPEIESGIFTINPANIGLMLVASLSLGLIAYTRLRTKTTKSREGKSIPQLPVRELPATPLARPKYQFTGIKGRILSAYISGLGVVEKITGTPMAPHTTLREFLKTAALQLPTAIKPFAELTTIAEVALYSGRRLDEALAIQAEQLAATIKEELHRGPA